jgi:hypothetical protein
MPGPGYTHRGTCASVMSGATRRQALLTTTPDVKSPERGGQFSVELDPTRGDSAALLVCMGNGESFAAPSHRVPPMDDRLLFANGALSCD